MRKIRVLVVVLLLFLGGCITQQTLIDQIQVEIEDNLGDITLIAHKGTITVEELPPGERAYVHVRLEVKGTVSSLMQNYLKSLRPAVTKGQGSLTVASEPSIMPPGVSDASVRYTLYVNPNQLEKLTIRTSNAPVVVRDFRGELTVSTSNAPIEVQTGVGKVHLSTSNGNIRLIDVSLTQNSAVDTTKGRIHGSLDILGGSIFSFLTTEGNVELLLPPSIAGRLELNTTSSGRINVNLDNHRITGGSGSFVSGEGTPRIRVTTSGGDITLLGR